MRIGEVAARTGVGAATLRAWERRYGVLQPARTPGGHRVYGDADVARVRAVKMLVEAGASVSEAARRLADTHAPESSNPDDARRAVWEAVDSFDERAARATLATATVRLGIPTLLDAVLVPVLRRLGSEWRASPRNVAREHFTSTLVRAHLVQLLPSHPAASTSTLAVCPEGERHDIGLLMASLALAATGRAQVFLGGDTPFASLKVLLDELRPPVVLVGAATRPSALRFLDAWRPRADVLVVAGGAGFRPGDATRLRGRVHFGSYSDLPALLAG